MIRCAEADFEVLLVLVQPLPPRARVRVKLTVGEMTIELPATRIPPGALLSLPSEAAAMAKGSWQSAGAGELAIEILNGGQPVRAMVSLSGLAPALGQLGRSCPLR
jgi:hypothetical protein